MTKTLFSIFNRSTKLLILAAVILSFFSLFVGETNVRAIDGAAADAFGIDNKPVPAECTSGKYNGLVVTDPVLIYDTSASIAKFCIFIGGTGNARTDLFNKVNNLKVSRTDPQITNYIIYGETGSACYLGTGKKMFASQTFAGNIANYWGKINDPLQGDVVIATKTVQNSFFCSLDSPAAQPGGVPLRGRIVYADAQCRGSATEAIDPFRKTPGSDGGTCSFGKFVGYNASDATTKTTDAKCGIIELACLVNGVFNRIINVGINFIIVASGVFGALIGFILKYVIIIVAGAVNQILLINPASDTFIGVSRSMFGVVSNITNILILIIVAFTGFQFVIGGKKQGEISQIILNIAVTAIGVQFSFSIIAAAIALSYQLGYILSFGLLQTVYGGDATSKVGNIFITFTDVLFQAFESVTGNDAWAKITALVPKIGDGNATGELFTFAINQWVLVIILIFIVFMLFRIMTTLAIRIAALFFLLITAPIGFVMLVSDFAPLKTQSQAWWKAFYSYWLSYIFIMLIMSGGVVLITKLIQTGGPIDLFSSSLSNGGAQTFTDQIGNINNGGSLLEALSLFIPLGIKAGLALAILNAVNDFVSKQLDGITSGIVNSAKSSLQGFDNFSKKYTGKSALQLAKAAAFAPAAVTTNTLKNLTNGGFGLGDRLKDVKGNNLASRAIRSFGTGLSLTDDQKKMRADKFAVAKGQFEDAKTGNFGSRALNAAKSLYNLGVGTGGVARVAGAEGWRDTDNALFGDGNPAVRYMKRVAETYRQDTKQGSKMADIKMADYLSSTTSENDSVGMKKLIDFTDKVGLPEFVNLTREGRARRRPDEIDNIKATAMSKYLSNMSYGDKFKFNEPDAIAKVEGKLKELNALRELQTTDAGRLAVDKRIASLRIDGGGGKDGRIVAESFKSIYEGWNPGLVSRIMKNPALAKTFQSKGFYDSLMSTEDGLQTAKKVLKDMAPVIEDSWLTDGGSNADNFRSIRADYFRELAQRSGNVSLNTELLKLPGVTSRVIKSLPLSPSDMQEFADHYNLYGAAVLPTESFQQIDEILKPKLESSVGANDGDDPLVLKQKAAAQSVMSPLIGTRFINPKNTSNAMDLIANGASDQRIVAELSKGLAVTTVGGSGVATASSAENSFYQSLKAIQDNTTLTDAVKISQVQSLQADQQFTKMLTDNNIDISQDAVAASTLLRAVSAGDRNTVAAYTSNDFSKVKAQIATIASSNKSDEQKITDLMQANIVGMKQVTTETNAREILRAVATNDNAVLASSIQGVTTHIIDGGINLARDSAAVRAVIQPEAIKALLDGSFSTNVVNSAGATLDVTPAAIKDSVIKHIERQVANEATAQGKQRVLSDLSKKYTGTSVSSISALKSPEAKQLTPLALDVHITNAGMQADSDNIKEQMTMGYVKSSEPLKQSLTAVATGAVTGNNLATEARNMFQKTVGHQQNNNTNIADSISRTIQAGFAQQVVGQQNTRSSSNANRTTPAVPNIGFVNPGTGTNTTAEVEAVLIRRKDEEAALQARNASVGISNVSVFQPSLPEQPVIKYDTTALTPAQPQIQSTTFDPTDSTPSTPRVDPAPRINTGSIKLTPTTPTNVSPYNPVIKQAQPPAPTITTTPQPDPVIQPNNNPTLTGNTTPATSVQDPELTTDLEILPDDNEPNT
jgi:hypothetical protein